MCLTSDTLILIAKNYLSNDVKSLSCIWLLNKITYISLYADIEKHYHIYIHSDKYRYYIIDILNSNAYMINEIMSCKISDIILFDYLIMCYKNWNWLCIEKYKQKLNIPNSKVFFSFLKNRLLTLDNILPNYNIKYIHSYIPEKEFKYYNSLT